MIKEVVRFMFAVPFIPLWAFAIIGLLTLGLFGTLLGVGVWLLLIVWNGGDNTFARTLADLDRRLYN